MPAAGLGGYAPREAVVKQKALSYSRAMMAVTLPGSQEGQLSCAGQQQGCQAQPHWAAASRQASDSYAMHFREMSLAQNLLAPVQ